MLGARCSPTAAARAPFGCKMGSCLFHVRWCLTESGALDFFESKERKGLDESKMSRVS